MKNHKLFWFLIILFTVTMINLSWYKAVWYIIFSVLVAIVYVAYAIHGFIKSEKETEKRINEAVFTEKVQSICHEITQLDDAVAEMSKSVRCLALELPEPVWDDVNARWNAVVAQLSDKRK